MDKPEFHTIIKEGIEDKIAVFQSFFSRARDIRIEVRAESETNSETWLLLLHADFDDRPLSMIVFLEFDEERAKKAARSLGLFLMAFGYEIYLDEDELLEPSEKEEESISRMFDFFSKHTTLRTGIQFRGDQWFVSATEGEDQVSLFSLTSDNKSPIMFAEKCLGLFLASRDKTVILAEGTSLNVYGCALYSQEDSKD